MAVNVHIEPELILRSPRERLRLITPHWPLYPEAVGVITVGLTFASQRREDSMFGTNLPLKGYGKGCPLPFFFPRVLEIAQPHFTRRDSAADGVIRTLSRTDGAFINLPTAEARDFHCYSHVFENFGERSTPSDHAVIRVVIQKTDYSGFRVGCPNSPFSAQI